MVLRQFTENDLENLAGLDSDPEVMRYLTGGKPVSRTVIETETLPKFLRWHGEEPDWGYWAAELKDRGTFLGWFHLRPALAMPDKGQPELGYRLIRAAWGQGYATEGSRALIRHAFEKLGVERVVASTMAVNLASRRVMERAGLRWVRTYYRDWEDPIPGSEHGEVEYRITRQDYLSAGG